MGDSREVEGVCWSGVTAWWWTVRRAQPVEDDEDLGGFVDGDDGAEPEQAERGDWDQGCR